MRHIICSMILVVCGPAWAQSPLAGEALQKRLSPYQGIKKMVAQFEQTRSLKRWKTSINTSGNLKFVKAEKTEITWEIIKPEYSALKFSNSGLSIKNNKNDSSWKNINNPNVKKQIEPIFSWLSFDEKQISKIYTVYSKERDSFQLIPKEKNSTIKEILISGKKGQVQQIIIKEQSDDEIKIKFKTVSIKK